MTQQTTSQHSQGEVFGFTGKAVEILPELQGSFQPIKKLWTVLAQLVRTVYLQFSIPSHSHACIMQILAKATYLESLSNEMKHKFTSTSISNYEHVPFMSSILALFHCKQYSPLQQSWEEHMQRLSNRSRDFGYEALSANSPLTDSTIFEEAPIFLESGQFNLELGNTMPLTMTYVFGIPIVIISLLENHELFRVDPETPITSRPIMLAFNQYEVGLQHGLLKDAIFIFPTCTVV